MKRRTSYRDLLRVHLDITQSTTGVVVAKKAADQFVRVQRVSADSLRVAGTKLRQAGTGLL